MKRKYTAKDPFYNIYSDEIDRRMLNSEILNGGNKKPNIHTSFNIENVKFQIVGDKNGITKRDSLGYPIALSESLIVKNQLIEIEEKFQRYCEQAKNQGRSVPKQMTGEILKEKILVEARQYVMEMELQEINRRLAIIAEKGKEKSDSNILKSGPCGSSELNEGKIMTIDGMKCSEIKTDDDETIFIICEDHPKAKRFTGYQVADYLQFIVHPWKIGCSLLSEQNLSEAKRKGIRLETLTKSQKSGLSFPIPEFPKDCMRYDKILVTSNN